MPDLQIYIDLALKVWNAGGTSQHSNAQDSGDVECAEASSLEDGVWHGRCGGPRKAEQANQEMISTSPLRKFEKSYKTLSAAPV